MHNFQMTLPDAVKASRGLIGVCSLPLVEQTFPYVREVCLLEDSAEQRTANLTVRYVGDEIVARLLGQIEAEGKRVRFEMFGEELRANVFAMAFRETPTDFVVLYDGKASRCKRRFALVKELLHIHFDFFLPNYGQRDIVLALNTASACTRDFEFSRVLGYEDFCYYAALELFVPRSDGLRKKIVELKSFPHTDHTIAQALRVPLSAATLLFDGVRGTYLQASNAIHETLDSVG